MIRLLFLLFVLTLLPGMRLWGEESARPNFLVIAVDDLNDYVGCLDGHPNASTPNLDRLAKSGVLFTNAHCPSPVCNPSRAAIWTGLRPTTTGVTSNPDRWFRERPGFENVATLSQTMGHGGFRTYAFGKINHLGHGNSAVGEWDRLQMFNYGPVQEPKLTYRSGDRLTDWGVPPPGEKPSYDPDIAQRTIDALEDLHDVPLFLGCGFYRPHTPLYADQIWFDAHPLETIKLPPGAVEGDTGDLVYFGVKRRRPQDVEAPGLFAHPWIQASENWKAILQAYLASTSAMDHELGRVIKAFEESRYADNTYIILFSDHGWNLGEKEHWGKAALWEQTTRVPFIIAGPGIPKGVVCDRPVETLSIYPTVLDFAGLQPPHRLEAPSLRPLLEDAGATWEHHALTTFVDHHALRTDRWRYIRYSVGGVELYDMNNDPHELNNLAVSQGDKPEIKDRISELDVLMNAKLARYMR